MHGSFHNGIDDFRNHTILPCKTTIPYHLLPYSMSSSVILQVQHKLIELNVITLMCCFTTFK
jgi:hypothetical protein